MAQHAVDAMAHGDPLLFRLDVDVARAGLDPLREKLVDELDGGGRFVGGALARARVEAEVLDFDGERGRLGARADLRVPACDLLRDLRRRSFDPPHAMAGGEGDGALGVEVERVARGDEKRSILEAQREDAEASRPALVEERDGRGIDAGEVGVLRECAAACDHDAQSSRAAAATVTLRARAGTDERNDQRASQRCAVSRSIWRS